MHARVRPYGLSTLSAWGRVAALLVALTAAGSLHAATATYSIALDTDDNTTTGCVVAVAGGTVTGVEQIVTAIAETSTSGGMVIRLERQVCAGGTLGAPVAYDAATWSVGFGNGSGGTAVVESSVPLSLLPPGASMRATALSTGGGGQDVTASFPIALAAVTTGPGTPITPVPLSPWLVPPLALGVLLLAAWLRRRYPQQTGLFVLLVVFAVSGLVWAATVARDGNVGDWAGVAPAVTDPLGDAPADADLVAVFWQQDTVNLYLRFDADLHREASPPPTNIAPAVNAGDAQTITLPAAATLAGVASDDGLPNPPGALTTTWSKVSGPGTVAFGDANALSTNVTFSVDGVYVLRLTASDSVLSATSDVTITVNPVVVPPPVNAAPTVNAGIAQTITLPATASLAGTASDDGLPNPPAALTTTWSKLSGPGTVTFGNTNALSTTASFSLAGTYVLRLTASDSALSSTSDVTITVNPVVVPPPANGAPTVNAGIAQTITLPATASLSGTATDDGLPSPPAALTTTWSKVSGPGTVAFDDASALATNATFSVDGIYVLRLTASDSALSTTSDVTITVNAVVVPPPVNAAPTVNAGTAQTITLPATTSLAGTASDDGLPNPPAALTTTWSKLSGPGTVTFGNANALSTTAAFSVAGTYVLRLTASDSVLSATSDVTITVNPVVVPPPVNVAPAVNAGTAQTITLPATASLAGTASDDGLPNPPAALTTTWSKLSGPGSVTFGNANALSTTASFSAAGTYVLRLTASDSVLSATSDVTITVNPVVVPPPVNVAPAVNAGTAQTITLPATASLAGTASDDGLPNPPAALTTTWSKLSGPGTVTFGNANALSTTASFSLAGTYVLRLTASDSVLSSTSNVTITVNPVVVPPPVNAAPTVNAGTAQTITLPTTASLTGTASDDGLPNPPAALTTTWSKLSGPGTVTFGNANALSTTASFSLAGTYVLRLTASDSVLSSTSNVTITVNPVVVPPPVNAAPTVNAGTAQTITLPATASLTGTASDDGLPNPPAALTTTWSKLSGPGTVTFGNANALSTTAAFSLAGTYVLRLTTSDSVLSSTSDAIITVNADNTPVNRPPVLGAQASETVAIGAAFARTLTATDPDAGDILTFSLIAGPSGMGLSGAALSWPTTGLAAGDYPVTVRVTDSAGAFDQKSFSVTLRLAVAPTANDDRYKVKVGATLDVPAPGVLGNDTPAGASLTATKRTDPSKGTLASFNADGSFTYQAPAAFVQPGVDPTLMWREPVDMTGFAQVVDHNHDGFADIVVRRENILQSFDGRTGAFQWTFDPADTTNASVVGCEFFNGADAFATGDVDGSSTVLAVASMHCGPYGGEFYAADLTHATSGKIRAKWRSRNLTLPHPGAYANPGDTVLPNPPVRPFFQATLGSWPTLAKLTPSGGVKLLARRVISSTEGMYYPAGGGQTHAACRSVTGLPADEGQGCRATYLLDATNGDVEAVLTAPNPSNQQNTGSGFPTLQGGVVVADLDGDGQVEIVSGSDVFKLVAGAWTLAWQSPYEPNSVAVADLDGDGKAEVVMYQASWGLDSSADRGIYIYRHDGTLLRRIPRPPSSGMEGWLTIGDIDGDGAPEILATLGGYVYAYRADGRLAWIYTVPDKPEVLSGVTPNPVEPYYRAGLTAAQVYDLNLDGKPEVIVSVAARVIILDGATGLERWSIDHEGATGSARTLALADFDGDGHVDIATAGATRWNCSVLTFGPMPCLGNVMVLKGANHWAPGPGVFNQIFFRSGAVDDAGRILHDASVQRIFKMPKQQGTVIDPRERDGTMFTYDASANGSTSSPATVAIAIEPPNSPPVITSVPPTGLLSIAPFTRPVYQITAIDPDAGDTIHYELVSTTHPFASSGGVAVNAASGAVDFYTGPCGSGGPCAFGNIVVVVAAIDSFGARTEQSFIVNIGSDMAVVPDVVGQQQQAAFDGILAANLTPRVQQEVFSSQPIGTVLAQFPLPGASNIVTGSTVDLTVSKGPQPVTMPDVVGKTITEATQILSSLGLTFTVDPIASTSVPAGEVMTQTPPSGTLVAPGVAGPATLGVSTGPPLAKPVASIVVEPGETTRLVADNLAYRATAVFTDGTSADVTLRAAWSSSVTAVASVDGTGLVKALHAGDTVIGASLSGKAGNATLHVKAPLADTTDPTAAITSPGDGDAVTGPVAVVGTADDTNFLRYEVTYALASSDDFTLLREGTTPVTGGTLATFDPTVLVNDQYRIRLSVYDRAGNVTTTEVGVVVKGDRKVGLFTLTFTDLNVPMAGIPITISRTYDSRDKVQGDFGIGWRLGLSTLRLRTNRVLGTGWTRVVSGPASALNPTAWHTASVTLPDGHVERFDMRLSPTSGLGLLTSTRVTGFEPRTGAQGTLEVLGNTDLLVVEAGNEHVLVDDSTLEVYEPRRFRYTSREGARYEIDRIDGVTSVEDRNGNKLTIGPNGIEHSSGQRVQFVRDAKNRITSIIDPNGHAQAYAYDGNGDLAQHVDAVGGTSTYLYDRRHGLIEWRNALGVRTIRNDYDESGRLLSMTDAAGKTVTFDHDDAASIETVTDRQGNVTRLHYDADGNVTREERPVTIDGTLVTAVTTATFDALGNEISRVDPDGRTRTATFDGLLPSGQRIDPSGMNLVTTISRTAQGLVTSATDPAGGSYAFGYDGNGALVSATLPGGSFTFANNASGEMIERVDPMGNRTVISRDAAGRPIREERYDAASTLLRRLDFTWDASGNLTSRTLRRTTDGATSPLTTTYAYDAANRLVAETDPQGGVRRTEYDAAGRVAATIDPLGRRTTFAYDEMGQRTRTTYPDGAFETTTYDADGNVTATTDRAGRTTAYTYDELRRRVRTTLPGGASTQTIYSPGGRVLATVDARGQRFDYGYDTAGRRTSTTQPAVPDGPGGPLVRPLLRSSLDALGRVIASTDPKGRVTSYEFDGRGQRIKTIQADGATTLESWDALGRRTQLTDPDGKFTTYGYDGLGRLVSVTGAEGTATYTYDEADNRITQTDALGRVTRLRYDALNRLIERRYPGGESEYLAYDAAGELVARTNPDARTTTFTRDTMGNVLRKGLPDGTNVDFTYAPDGQRTSVVDARGTTTYVYDAAGRLASVTHPGGATLAYAYDANGNLVSLASPAGTASYAWDALDRLTQTTAPEGITSYGRDLVGNVVRRTAPNGVVTNVVVDARDRPTSIVQGSLATTLQSFAIVYSPAGRRTGITELDGSRTDYAYDALGHLAAETRTGTHPYTVTHAYDAAGNRTQSTRDGVTTTFTYDANDQLLQAGTTTYAWDANGNLASRTTSGVVTQFGFDAEHRLVTVQGGGASEQFEYDADGHRVRATDAAGSTRFLVDTMNPTGYAQVVEERDGSGALVARQTFDMALASTTRGGAARHVLADPFGSVRALTDSAGAITDRYLDDAYGVRVDTTGVTPNPYRYRGERADAFGFYDLRARAYDPAVGRFLSRDPWAGQGESPLSMHRYLYASGDPANHVDPSGMMSLPEVSIVSQIMAGLAVAHATSTFLGGILQEQGFALAAIGAGQQLAADLFMIGASEFVIARVVGPIFANWALPTVGRVLGRIGGSVGLTTSAAAVAEAMAAIRQAAPLYARLEGFLAKRAAGEALNATAEADIRIAQSQIKVIMGRLGGEARRAVRQAVTSWKSAARGSEIGAKAIEDTVRITETGAWELFCDMLLAAI